MELPPRYRRTYMEFRQQGGEVGDADLAVRAECASAYTMRWVVGAGLGGVGATAARRLLPKMPGGPAGSASSILTVLGIVMGGALATTGTRDACLAKMLAVDSPLGDVLRAQAHLDDPQLMSQVDLSLEARERGARARELQLTEDESDTSVHVFRGKSSSHFEDTDEGRGGPFGGRTSRRRERWSRDDEPFRSDVVEESTRAAAARRRAPVATREIRERDYQTSTLDRRGLSREPPPELEDDPWAPEPQVEDTPWEPRERRHPRRSRREQEDEDWRGGVVGRRRGGDDSESRRRW